MTISIDEAYARGSRALAPHADKPREEARVAAMLYIEDLLGIDPEEWKEGAVGEILGLVLAGAPASFAGPALLSSFAAGVEWQRERDDA